MNIPVLIAACISLIGLLAHLFVGTKETATLNPKEIDKETINSDKRSINWKQAMCAFQLVTVDLLAVTVVLFIVSLTDIIPFEYEVTLFIASLLLLWGFAWLVQLLVLKTKVKSYAALPQWAFFFSCSGLLFWGA